MKALIANKIAKIWQFVNWLDMARWHSAGSEALIPGPAFKVLSNANKVLTHWLAYITDQQRPYVDVWRKGGPIFAEIVSSYTTSDEPVLSLLMDYTEESSKETGVDRFFSKDQEIEGGEINYTPRFGVHLLSIARTLRILDGYSRNIIDYLKANWSFCANSDGNDSDNVTYRTAFLLYLLSYHGLQTGITSVHRQDQFFEKNLETHRAYLHKIFSNPSQLEDEFHQWMDNRFHKRLWASFRDYIKPKGYYRKVFSGALEENGHISLADYLRKNERQVLHSLELPGDTWNLRFNERIFRGEITSPKQLREIFISLKRDGFVDDAFYPEQFDFSFDYSPSMCEELNEQFCIFRQASDIGKFCFGVDCHYSGDKLCSVAMICCGYEYPCSPKVCPIKEPLHEDLCPGCRMEVRAKH